MQLPEVKKRLEENYKESVVEVVDLTGTGDHYQVTVVSNAFTGMSRIQQHKSVMNVFDAELKSGEVHALSIKTAIPQVRS